MSTPHDDHRPRTAAATVAGAGHRGAGCPAPDCGWWPSSVRRRYIRGDAITAVAPPAGRRPVRVEATPAYPDELGRRQVLLRKLPDIGTASNLPAPEVIAREIVEDLTSAL